MRRHRWRLLGLLVAGCAWSSVAQAQVSGVGRAQLPSALLASVPAMAVLTAVTAPDRAPDPRGRRRWRAVLRTGANDRHALRIRGLSNGWTVQIADAAVPSHAPSGGEVVVAPRLARGYHDIVLWLEGPARQSPSFEAVVQTIQVPGGLAVATLAASPIDGNLQRP